MSRRRHPDPWLFVLLAMTVGPVVAGLGFMLLYSVGGIGLLATGWTLRYWTAALQDSETWVALGYSFAVGLVSLVLALALALGLQAALGAQVRRRPLRGLLFVPLAVPALVAALLSVELFGNAGLLARLAHAVGWIAQPADFPNLLFTPAGSGIVLTHVLLVGPFLLLLLDRLARHERVEELAWVARTLGASRWQAWRKVTVPVLLRAGMPTLSVYFIVLVGAFEVPLLVGASYPQMISVLVQRQFSQFDLASKPQAYVVAVLYGVLAMGLLLALFAWRGRRDAAGGSR
ncbi:MAG: ABC transporter permease subunit [Rhodanobacteraceae bacterium]|nr:MAG: ABC transporter permease subunit [Rhodanobacteraceae bacterium]